MTLDVLETASRWPLWVPTTLGGVLLAAVVATVFGAHRSGWLSGIGPQAVVALGGVTVSIHGLWGFARHDAGLDPLLSVAFLSVFDAAELVLLVMLYRSADPKVGWTRELRLMHRTAWMQVAFSAAMNAMHAPNWWARPILAAIPALATWLIELKLRAKMAPAKTDNDEAGGRPGPMRLLVVAWQHAWSAVFAALGLDAGTTVSDIAKAARVQRAARRVYRLRLALNIPDTRSRVTARRRRKAQRALDRADIGTDQAQSLALTRRLAALTRADEVACADFADPAAVLDLLDGLAVTPVAERLQAEGARQRAAAETDRAEGARQEAETARQRAVEELSAAREELARIEEEMATARQRAADAREEDQGARQRADTAREEIDAARTRAEEITDDARRRAEQTRQQADRDLHEVREAIEGHQRHLDALQGQTGAEQQRHQQLCEELERLTAQAREAAAARDRLRGDLAALVDPAEGEEVVYRSEAKQAGWEHYQQRLDASGGEAEPTAGEMAERFGIDAGNARNWLRDFRAARAAQLAAHPPRATAQSDAEAAMAGVS